MGAKDSQAIPLIRNADNVDSLRVPNNLEFFIFFSGGPWQVESF
jgi:hypothetical protein